jgi:hypothetical protein
MASPSVIDAFESAKKNFFSHLPKNTNYDFTSLPTIDHVYQAAEKLQKQQERSRSMRYLGKIEPFLESLRHYGNIVDTFVQVKPDVLALIWVGRSMKHSSNGTKRPVRDSDHHLCRGLSNFCFR